MRRRQKQALYVFYFIISAIYGTGNEMLDNLNSSSDEMPLGLLILDGNDDLS